MKKCIQSNLNIKILIDTNYHQEKVKRKKIIKYYQQLYKKTYTIKFKNTQTIMYNKMLTA